MAEKNYQIAKELKERLTNAVTLLDCRLFGSRAREDYDEYSDMDVFVKVENLTNEKKDIIHEIAWEIGFKHFIVISIIIFSKHELEKTPLRSSPLVRNVYREGVSI